MPLLLFRHSLIKEESILIPTFRFEVSRRTSVRSLAFLVSA